MSTHEGSYRTRSRRQDNRRGGGSWPPRQDRDLFLVVALVPSGRRDMVCLRAIHQGSHDRGIRRPRERPSRAASPPPAWTSSRRAMPRPCSRSWTSSPASAGSPTSWSTTPRRSSSPTPSRPSVPAGIIDKNIVPGDRGRGSSETSRTRTRHGRATARSSTSGCPWPRASWAPSASAWIGPSSTRRRPPRAVSCSSLFGGVAALTVIGGALLARRITRPITRLAEAAQRVGEGDLSETVAVTSRDEIGKLAQTFNDTIVRLRSQVQTESERDDERRRREDLQESIIKFLDVAMEVSQGDLTKRGEVTSDVLGNVVDAINVMVAEIGAIIGDVRGAALQVAAGAHQMTDSSGRMTEGAQAQAREASRVAESVEGLTLSVRQVADSARASAHAAREAPRRGPEGGCGGSRQPPGHAAHPRRGAVHLQEDQEPGRSLARDLRDRQHHRGHRLPDQSRRPQRRHRGGGRRRGGLAVRRGRRRSAQAGRALGQGDQGHRGPHQERPGGHAGRRGGHGTGDPGGGGRLSHDRSGRETA